MIIFISGSINSGKSTAAKLLSQKINKPALIEIDILSDFIDWLPIDQKIQINLENAVLLINNFIKQGFNIIVPYPLSRQNYDFLLSQIDASNQKIYAFILNPDLDIILSDRGGRQLNDWESDRIKHHYQQGINNPGFGEVINNSNQSPEETVGVIFNLIK
jgi:hypothetical protein